MSDEDKEWFEGLFEEEIEEKETFKMQAYKLQGMTAKQEDALRTLAQQVGFKDMRGFNSWMEAADLTYYDLIKVASPE